MRLAILDSGHRPRTKALFLVMRALSRLPVPDAVKLNRYRPGFYGRAMRTLSQEAMRGPSAWSVGDRELMGAVVSQANGCDVCTRTHGDVAALAYRDPTRVSAVLTDPDASDIDEPLRATLHFLRKLAREHAVTSHDVQTLLAAGVSREQIEDALAVGFVFNAVDRLSRAFDFVVSSERAYRAGARFLLMRGYG